MHAVLYVVFMLGSCAFFSMVSRKTKIYYVHYSIIRYLFIFIFRHGLMFLVHLPRMSPNNWKNKEWSWEDSEIHQWSMNSTGKNGPKLVAIDHLNILLIENLFYFLDTSQLPPGLVVCVSEHSPLWPMLLVLSVQELVSYFYIFTDHFFFTRLSTIIFRYPFGCHHHLSVLWNFRQGTTRIRWHGWHAVLNSDWLTDISRFLRNGANSSSSRLRLDKL